MQQPVRHLLMPASLLKQIQKELTAINMAFIPLRLTEGNYVLVASYVGYVSKAYEISLQADTLLNIDLKTGITFHRK